MERKSAELRQQHEQARVQFIITELDLALTFSQISRSTREPSTSERHKEHAATAYKTALRFLDDMKLKPSEAQAIRERLDKLRTAMPNLKEGAA